MSHKVTNYMIKNIFSKLSTFFFFAFLAVVLALTVRGSSGNPTSDVLNSRSWIEEGPFESSNERGRFALLYSVIEDNSFYFSVPLARFSAPDLGYTDGHYVSLFAPGVSFIVMPGYLIGKLFGLSQLGTFIQVSLFAMLNVYLIRKIAIHLEISPLIASVAGLIFLFATPAFAYGITLYQHHISTFLLLLCSWLLIRYNNVLSLIWVWLLAALSAIIDYPNAFMMVPIVVTAVAKFFIITKDKTDLHITFLYPRLLSVMSALIPFAFLLYFNQMSYQNPFQLSGGVANVQQIDAKGLPVTQESSDDTTTVVRDSDLTSKQNVVNFFQTRNIVNGLYVLFISEERGMAVYTPIMLFGIIGAIIAVRTAIKSQSSAHIAQFTRHAPLLMMISLINILLYSMWGDPHGGWAFGSRYLIPSYAIFAIFIAYLLQQWKEKLLFLLLFFIILCYSVSISTLGALTSNLIPPKVEAITLEERYGEKQHYTYQRNIELLNSNVSRSFVYQTFAKPYITVWQYFTFMLGLLLLPFLLLFSLITNAGKEIPYKIDTHNIRLAFTMQRKK